MKPRCRSVGTRRLCSGDSGCGSPSPIHSGPGRSREFALASKFTTQDPLKHGSRIEEPFVTYDFAKVNKDLHQWQRFDTFQTPTTCCGPSLTDMEDTLGSLRDEILEGCRADISSVAVLVRQEVDRSIWQIISQVKKVLRDQNADSLNLIAELGRVRSAEADLSDVLKEVQEGRRGETNMILEALHALQGGVEASSEKTESIRSAISSLEARQGTVEEGVSEVNEAVRRVMSEVAEIRKVKTELEFRNVREKKIEVGVEDALREVRELKTSLEASGVCSLSPQLGKLSDKLHAVRGREAGAGSEAFEAQLRRALVSGEHLSAFRGELREVMRMLMGELDSRGEAAMTGAMEGVTSTLQAKLADVIREVRRVKADVDLKVTREGGTRDVKIFVSNAAQDKGVPKEDAHGVASHVGLAGPARQEPVKPREGARAAPSESRGTDLGVAAEPWSNLPSARRGEDSQRSVERPPPRGGSRKSSRASEVGRPGLSEAEMAALRAVFERVDTNGSGSISMIETVKALRTDERFARAMGFEGTVHVRQEDGTREAFMKAFQRVDTNRNASISWEELVRFAARRCAAGLGIERAGRAAGSLRGSPEDSETSLSHEEEYHGSIIDGRALDRAIQRARGEGAEPPPRESSGLGKEEKAALRNMFDRVDANGSGRISIAETIKALRVDDTFARVLGFDGAIRVRQEDGTRDAFCRAFQQVDADGDNNITWEELLVFASGQRGRNKGIRFGESVLGDLGDKFGELEDLRR